jgi:hypothetical protein
MRKFSLTLAAACLATLGLASLPATAQQSPAPNAAAPHPMQHMMGMHHKMAHPASCYDYAWESQEQKDCLAKGDQPAPMMKKHMTKKPMTPKAS